MKKVLLIQHSKTADGQRISREFNEKIAEILAGDVVVEYCDIADLVFDISHDTARIFHPKKQFDVREFGLVVFRHFGKFIELASAMAYYLKEFSVKYIDSFYGNLEFDNKLRESLYRFFNDLPQPRTICGDSESLAKSFAKFNEKAVLKDIHGSKGRLNFLIKNPEEIAKIMHENPDTQFILQEFIPNNGDLRILVFNFKSTLVISRRRCDGAHLNNTSQGGMAKLIPVENIRRETLELAESAARSENVEVAGVDIITDVETDKDYILEVNRAPQIQSGSFVKEKTGRYALMLREMLESS